MFNYFDFAQRCKRPLILDGAIGTLLIEMGLKPDASLWTSGANISRPELVTSVHEKYLKAGADIITTNTFRTNPTAVKHSNKNQIKLVRAGVTLAKESSANYNALIAGCNPPAEDCYQKERTISRSELAYNHQKHIEQLIEFGSDFVLNETQSHFDEISIIVKFCSENSIPFVMSFYCDENLKLLSGETLSDAIKYVAEFQPMAIGINCIQDYLLLKSIRKLPSGIKWGFYLNCGVIKAGTNKFICTNKPYDYLETVKISLSHSPSFIGACCASSPKHISAIKKYFDGKVNR